MRDAVHDTRTTLTRLEALLASGVLTQAEAVSCAALADALRRPARVAVLGQSAADVTGILRSMLGESVVTLVPGGPAVELHLGDQPRHVATFEDGSSLSQEGYPAADLMRYGPLLLEIEAPNPVLETMSFLAVELGAEPEDCAAALGWAAKRSEIAIFCADAFTGEEAAIWSAAPDRLKNHCYLVVTGGREAASLASAQARGHFDAVIHAPVPSEAMAPLGALKHRLAADIDAARAEDIDAAELFLHRFRRPAGEERQPETVEPEAWPEPLARERPATQAAAPVSRPVSRPTQPAAAPAEAVPEPRAARAAGAPRTAKPAPKPEPAEAPDLAGAISPDDPARAAARALVSGPILHLKRRSRALAEMLEWREEDEEWCVEVLEHCCETAEALRELVASWPEDDPLAARLREAIDQACDTVVLLQVERGPEQAEDAARVLFQLRTDFEQALAA
ncbi:hypothetical protein [Roseicyclus sp.]|uniref:hypothetical protein n=1 Tax=Roseicyclus sp. TaxID=1914329 RepID=UPI003FA0C72E